MKCEICGMENAKLRVKDLYYHKKCLLEHGEKREISEIRERGEFKEVGKKRYCNKCQAEIQPIKESKTLAKSFVNFLSSILFYGPVYMYPRRCPNCGKVLRTKGQIISGIMCIAIVLTISIIIFFATR
ncbi:MAG: hypothetical protein ACFFAK_15065 [Promethearchaeota archaeon]